MLNQNELEQVIKFQKQSLDYLYKWLAEEVEKDKTPNVFQTDEEREAMERELEYDYNQQMRQEEGFEDEPELGGHIEDPEIHREELKREKENL